MKKRKDYTVGTYIKKKPRKEKTGSICPVCSGCKNKRFCRNRRDTKLMQKCQECKECYDKENCDTFYIFEEHKATITLGKDEKTGRVIKKSFCGKTEREAIARSLEYQKSIESGEIIVKVNTQVHSVASIIQDYEDRKFKLGRTKSSAYHTNMDTLKRIKKESWSNKPIAEVTSKQIERFLDNERLSGMSNSILKKDYSLLRCAFDISLEKRLYTSKPTFLFRQIWHYET